MVMACQIASTNVRTILTRYGWEPVAVENQMMISTEIILLIALTSVHMISTRRLQEFVAVATLMSTMIEMAHPIAMTSVQALIRCVPAPVAKA
jgi:hypothetical protein